MRRTGALRSVPVLLLAVSMTDAHGSEPIPQGNRIVYESPGGLGGAVVGGLVGYGVGMATNR